MWNGGGKTVTTQPIKTCTPTTGNKALYTDKMNTEIEHKYLVVNDQYKTMAHRVKHIAQGYLSLDPARTVRVRVADHEAFLTVKSNLGATALSHPEYEFEIDLEKAHSLLHLCLGEIEKDRYLVKWENVVVEVDVFHGRNEGLILAEIEVTDEAQTFSLPPFLGQEVTQDPRYYNAYLAQHPFSTWAK